MVEVIRKIFDRLSEATLLGAGLLVGSFFRFISLVVCLLREYRKTTHSVLALKLIRKVNSVFGIIIAIPVVLIVRLVAGWVLIRFGHTRSDVIGHSLFDTTYYLAEREFDRQTSLDIFYFKSPYVANAYWESVIRRKLRIHHFARYCDLANGLIPGGSSHKVNQVPSPPGESRDLRGILAATSSPFSFSNNEQTIGEQFLRMIGMPTGSKYVCLITRDSAYKRSVTRTSEKDWGYHSFRDTDIDAYRPMVQELMARGYWVIRMGKVAEKSLSVPGGDRFFDYSSYSEKTDFLDIWLMSGCTFCVSNGTGLDAVTDAFRIPLVDVDYLPINHIVSYNCAITVPKKLHWQRNKDMLSLREYLEHSYFTTQEYSSAGIQVVDLAPDEITKAVVEMDERLSGRWENAEGDEDRQKKFWAVLGSSADYTTLHGVIHPRARCGADFLDRYSGQFLK